MWTKLSKSGSVCLLGFALLAANCFAQFSSSIRGVVQDPSRAAVANAQVTLQNTATGVTSSTTSDSDGNYRFISLGAGNYQVTATAPGFNKSVITATLTTDQQLNVPVTLTLKAQNQAIEVTSAAPLVNTADDRTQLTLQTQAIESFPLQGRNLVQLATLAPGASGHGTASGGSPGSAPDNFSTETQVDVSANGRGSVGNLYLVDGLDVTSDIRPGVLNLMPNPDSIRETTIQTNVYSVQYGRASSIEMIMGTKSGTDQFHGDISDYFTSEQFWAGTEFVHSYAPFHSNNMSAALGGPLIPHHQFFFFASVEPLRSTVTTGVSTVTYEDPQFVAFAQKNFPGTLGTQILTQYKPVNGATTSVAQTGQQAFPGTCGTAATSYLSCSMPVVDNGILNTSQYRNGLQWNARFDKYWNSDRLYGNYYRTTLNQQNAFVRPAFNSTGNYYTDAFEINETHTISPTTLNEALFAYIRVDGLSPVQGLFTVPSIGVTGINQGFGDGGGGNEFIQHNYHWRDMLTKVVGNHTLNFGYDGWHGDDLALFAPGYSIPAFQFNNLLDLVQDNPYTESGLAYNPLSGQPAPGQYEFAETTQGAFVQDSWKLKPNFTLTLGIRWDDYGNPYPEGGTVLANFHLGAGSTFNQQVTNGYMQQQNHVFDNPLYAVFSPRVGFAWDPTGKGKWVVRGGAGVYHDWPTLGNVENGLKGNPPGWINPTFYNNGSTASPIFGLGSSNTYPYGYAYPSLPPTTLDSKGGLVGRQLAVGGTDPNLGTPETYNYSATMEHQLTTHITGSVGYSGSHSDNLLVGSGQTTATSYGYNINRYSGDLIQHDSSTPTGLNTSFGSIGYTYAGAYANYNALIAGAKGQFKNSFFNIYYTRSKSEDDTQVYALPTNIGQYYGPSAWDSPNRLSISWSYDLPNYHRGLGFVGRVIGGWSISGTSVLQSGNPYTVNTTAPFAPLKNSAGQIIGFAPGSGDYNADGYNNDYPNVISYTTPTSHTAFINGVISPSNFPTPALGTEGNELYNRFRGPAFYETDAALLKNTDITERWKLQLRFEVFNILNHPNMNGVDSNLADASFGKSTSQFNPRWIQLGAKITF